MTLASDHAYNRLRQRLSAGTVGAGGSALQWVPALALVAIGSIALRQGRLDIVEQNLAAAAASGREHLVDVNELIRAARALIGSRPGCRLVAISVGDGCESSHFALLPKFAAADRVRLLSATGGTLLPATCAAYLVSVRQPDRTSG